MVRACEISGLVSIVRPPVNRPDVILRFLDRGAQGVQVPHVNTAAEARAVVEAVKFHPLGKRGYTMSSRAAHYGLKEPAAQYLESADRETLVCVLIEEVEGVRNLDEMLKVEGIDVYFVGSGDLSQSMGYAGQPDAPKVRALVNEAVDKILRAKRVAGASCANEDTAKFIQKGVLYFHTGLTHLVRYAAAHYFSLVDGRRG
jgi:4-hydroxy-2-oxoheptanedioate aldolase